VLSLRAGPREAQAGDPEDDSPRAARSVVATTSVPRGVQPLLTRMDRLQRYTTVVVQDSRRRVLVPVPFDPNNVWGAKKDHRVAGSVNGMGVRAVIEPLGDDGCGILLGPAWRRDCGIAPGDEVDVVLYPEGPQRDDLAPDIAAALAAEPAAAAFFDSLAQFYRNAYLRWIDATKRRPEVRAARIAAMVELCNAGIKQRPGT
jgi:Bacteriocin-protection, YdeI or OmpD-Associated/Domain of unknown function (DUF1905)